MARFLILSLLLALTACTTYSRKQCEAMDWPAQGREAALNGKDARTDIVQYRKDCTTAHGVAVDVRAYRSGFDRGIAEVCTPKGVRDFADRGLAYPSFCPVEKESEFQPHFQTGQLSHLTRTVSEMRAEIQELKNELSQKDAKISDLESEVSNLQMQQSL